MIPRGGQQTKVVKAEVKSRQGSGVELWGGYDWWDP